MGSFSSSKREYYHVAYAVLCKVGHIASEEVYSYMLLKVCSMLLYATFEACQLTKKNDLRS